MQQLLAGNTIIDIIDILERKGEANEINVQHKSK